MNVFAIRKLVLGLSTTICVSTLVCLVAYWCVFYTSELPAFRQFFDPYGFIDKSGQLVLDLRSYRRSFLSELPKKFSEKLCVIYGFHGNSSTDFTPFANYVNQEGRLIKPDFNYIFASDFSEGFAAVIDFSCNADLYHAVNWTPGKGSCPDYRWTFIDTHGRVRYGPFCSAQNFAEGLAAVRISGEPFWKFIDQNGKCVIRGKFEKVTQFSEGRAGVLVNGKWGLIDRNGKQVLPPTYLSKIHPFREGLAAVEVQEAARVDYLDRGGLVQFSLERNTEKSPLNNVDVSEGLVVSEKNHKFGFVDLSGKEVIPPVFNSCLPFSEGRARVSKEIAGKEYFGYVDRRGSLVVPCDYVEAFPYSEGFAVVTTDTRARYYKYIDLSGRYCFDGRAFPGAQSFHEGRAFVGGEYISLP